MRKMPEPLADDYEVQRVRSGSLFRRDLGIIEVKKDTAGDNNQRSI
jgi:hypothetical protein